MIAVKARRTGCELVQELRGCYAGSDGTSKSGFLEFGSQGGTVLFSRARPQGYWLVSTVSRTRGSWGG
jgi:hypothetical protein